MGGFNLEYFGLTRCFRSDQAFKEFKHKWILSLSAERRASIMLPAAIDQITDATYQVKQSLKTV